MRVDRVGERAVPELAVDVGRDRAADGDVARAGHDHREPSEREEHAHQHLDADARLDRAGALGDVELEDAVELRAPHDVAAARSARRRRSCGRARARRCRARRAGARPSTSRRASLGAARLPHLRAARRGAAPAGQHLACAPSVSPCQPPCTAIREAHHPHHADREQHAIGEHELFGRAAVALREQQRVAEDAERERHDRELEPRLLADGRRLLERPEAVGEDRDARRRPRGRSRGTPRCSPRASAGGSIAPAPS